MFQSLTRFEVGDGRKLRFWTDRWIAGHGVADIAPLIFGCIPTRRRNQRTAAEAMINNNWILDIPEGLTDEACAQCVRLWLALSNIQKNEGEEDMLALSTMGLMMVDWLDPEKAV